MGGRRVVLWLSLLLCLACTQSAAGEVAAVLPESSESTHVIITLKPPGDLPDNLSPSVALHEQASRIIRFIPNSSLVHIYENIATHFKIYMFSMRLNGTSDFAKLGDIFGKDITAIEAVSTFTASELLTDVRNLAHGLPYRQVLNRPYRAMNQIASSNRAELQEAACTIEDAAIENLTRAVRYADIVIGDDDDEATHSVYPMVFDNKLDEMKEPDGPVTVFVLDTGIQVNHSWFEPEQARVGFDYEMHKAGVDASSVNFRSEDENGHGTKVAGIIGGRSPSSASGGKNCHLVSVRVLDASGQGESDDIIAGLDYAVGAYTDIKLLDLHITTPQKHAAAITHMSFTGKSSSAMTSIIDAVSTVMPVVGASGDTDSFSCWTTPGDCKNVLVVGASDRVTNMPITGSNYGECISIMAPGQDVTAPDVGVSGDAEKRITGSSAAAARVTAILVNVLTIIDANRRLYSAYHNQIAELDVAVFLKTVMTELAYHGPRSLVGGVYSEVHLNGFVSCVIDSFATIKLKLEERLRKTVSKTLVADAQLDESGVQAASPMQRLKDKFKELKKRGNTMEPSNKKQSHIDHKDDDEDEDDEDDEYDE